jgi:hypothetical protein
MAVSGTVVKGAVRRSIAISLEDSQPNCANGSAASKGWGGLEITVYRVPRPLTIREIPYALRKLDVSSAAARRILSNWL